MKPKLVLNKNQFKHGGTTLGMKDMLHSIGESDLFDVSFHNESVTAMRGMRATVIYYNDKKVYLDLWEYPTPSHTMEVYNANFDLIIKVQHKNIGARQYNRYCSRKRFMSGITDAQRTEFLNKIVPWTFFPSRMMEPFVGREDEFSKENYPIERDAFFCGKNWKCRKEMVSALSGQGIECLKSNQELKRGKTLGQNDYLHYMRSSKYGLILRGRSSMLTDCKNRREIDYMILQKPIVMDYEPFYYNPMVAGEHYILIDKNTDIKSLDSLYNTHEIAKNGYEWYKKNATKSAIANTFLQIMNEKLS